MAIRTITLTDRTPVRIEDENWKMIASASDKEFDNQYEFQANRISKWFIGVRQHADGRAIVYATYSYSSNWQGARDYSAKHGELLAIGADIVRAIKDVAAEMSACECDGEDGMRWTTLADECIADLPAEELA